MYNNNTYLELTFFIPIRKLVHTTPEEFEDAGFTSKTHQMFSVRTTPEEFENRGFTLKAHQTFSVHTTAEGVRRRSGFTLKTHQTLTVHRPEEFKNASIIAYFDLCLRKPRSEKSHDYRDVIIFEKLCFQNVFRPHENEKPVFSNPSGLKNIFEKFRFRDGLVWTAGLTGEITLDAASSTYIVLGDSDSPT